MNSAFSENLVINEETLPVVSRLAECIPGGFFIYRADGDEELIYFNSRMPVLFGCGSDEEFRAHVGNSFKGIVHPDDLKICEKNIEEQIEKSEENLDHVKYRIIRRDGSIGILDDYGYFSHSESFGDVYYVFVEDITEQIEEEKYSAIAQKYIEKYESVFIVDLKEDSFSLIKRNDKLNMNIPEQGAFSSMISVYIDNFVYAPDREGMKTATDRRLLLNRLKNEDTITVKFNFISKGYPSAGKMKIAKLNDNEVIAAFRDIDNETMNEAIVEAVFDDYFGIYYVDLENDSIRVVKNSVYYSDLKVAPYKEAFDEFTAGIEESFKEHMKNYRDVNWLKNSLKNTNKIEFSYYSSYAESWVRLESYVLNRDKEGIAVSIVHCFALANAYQLENIRLNEQTLRQMNIIKGLSEDYTSVCYVDLDKKSIERIAISSETKKNIDPFFTDPADIEDSYSRFLEDFVHPEDRELIKDVFDISYIEEVLSNVKEYSICFRRLYDGVYKWSEVKLVKAEAAGKRARHVAVGFAEIDERYKAAQSREKIRKEYEDQLIAARDKAVKANKSKSEFLFNMSHDIRTPLNAIMGFSDMAIKRIDDKGKLEDYLVKIKQSGTLLLSLINGVLDMSRIEAGRAEIEENYGDVYLAFSQIKDSMEELAAEKELTITFEFGDIKDRYVYCDFSRSVRVLVNLISNAIKYNKEGGYVKVRCSQTGANVNGYGEYTFTVEDNGIGMSEKFQKKAFESFAREHNSTTSGIQGTGLGLAVCRTFVEMMHGSIELESKQGVGSKFTVKLPLRIQEENKYTDPMTGNVVSQSKELSEEKKIELKGRHILLVDDNEMNREIAADILQDAGIIVEEAEDGSVAVRLLEEKGEDFYDAVLMDIQMPFMNGYEATKAIRKMYPDGRIPIIALSANAFREDKEASKKAGMNDHLAKPIRIEELFDTLGRYL